MRSKIYNNLKESSFTTKTNRFIFYFSSEFNKKRFDERYLTYVTDETIKINQRYHVFDIKFNKIIEQVLMIAFYKKIEKRGFVVYDKTTSDYYKEES